MFEFTDKQKEIAKKYSDNFKKVTEDKTEKVKDVLSDIKRGNEFIKNEKKLKRLFENDLESTRFTKYKDDDTYILSLIFKDKHTETYQVDVQQIVELITLNLIQQGKL